MTDSRALDPYIAISTGSRYLEKLNPIERGAPYPHIAMGHSMFLVCIGVSGAIDKQLFTFLEGKIKQTQFHI